MAQKTTTTALRLNQSKSWKSEWTPYNINKTYPCLLHKSFMLQGNVESTVHKQLRTIPKFFGKKFFSATPIILLNTNSFTYYCPFYFPQKRDQFRGKRKNIQLYKVSKNDTTSNHLDPKWPTTEHFIRHLFSKSVTFSYELPHDLKTGSLFFERINVGPNSKELQRIIKSLKPLRGKLPSTQPLQLVVESLYFSIKTINLKISLEILSLCLGSSSNPGRILRTFQIILASLYPLLKKKGFQGIALQIKGKIGKKPRASKSFFSVGQLPSQSIDQSIFSEFISLTTKYGALGIRIWVFKK